jgi:hypothetical protein
LGNIAQLGLDNTAQLGLDNTAQLGLDNTAQLCLDNAAQLFGQYCAAQFGQYFAAFWAILRSSVWTILRSFLGNTAQLSLDNTAQLFGHTAQLNLDNTEQLIIVPRYNACDCAEAKRIMHISTNPLNKQAKIGWLCVSKEIQKFLLSKPGSTSFNIVNSFNHEAVKKYFENLVLVMEKHTLVEGQILNVDKFWISTV